MTIYRLVGIFIVALTLGMAVQAAEQEVLNNDSVIEMKKLGFGDTVLIEKIKTTPGKFDVTINGLKSLKTANVPDSVIAAMLSRNSAGEAGEKESKNSKDDAKNPDGHEPGIYMAQSSNGAEKLIRLEPLVYKMRQGTIIFAGFGQPIKQHAVLPGVTASLETTNRRPTFYFYFEKPASGLGDAQGTPTRPDAFTLGVFEIFPKEGERRMVVGHYNAYSGGISGVEGKFARAFEFEKLSPTAYKVVPKTDLANGEYGFFTPGNQPETMLGTVTTGGRMFEFRVNGSPETEPVSEEPKKSSKVKKK